MSGCRSAYPAYGERDGDSFRCARCGAWCHRNRQTRRWKHGRAPERNIAPVQVPVDRSDPYAGQSWATDLDRAAGGVVVGARVALDVGVLAHVPQYTCQEPPASGEHELMASHNPGQDAWAGGSWAEAEAWARDGWHEPIAATDATASEMAYRITAEYLTREWVFPRDVTGDAVDVAAFLTGEPECMVYAVQDDVIRGGDVVRLAVPVRTSSDVPVSLYKQRGAAIVALVDVLTTAGYAVEVWAVDVATDFGSTFEYSHAVQVQRAADPLDMGRIMFAMAHPCMLRRIGFAAQERVRADLRGKVGVPHGYGIPTAVTPGSLPSVDGPTIVLPLLDGSDDWSPEAAERWIVATLATLGSGGGD